MNRKRNKMGIVVVFVILFSIGTISLASAAPSPDLEEGEVTDYDVKYTISGTDDGEEIDIVVKGIMTVIIDEIDGDNITYTIVGDTTATGTIPDSLGLELSDFEENGEWTYSIVVDDDLCADSGYNFIDPSCELRFEDSDDGSDPDHTWTKKYTYDSAGRLKSRERTTHDVFDDGDVSDYKLKISTGLIIPSYPTVIFVLFSIIGVSTLLLRKRH